MNPGGISPLRRRVYLSAVEASALTQRAFKRHQARYKRKSRPMVNDPEEIVHREDGKLRHYKYVEEFGYHIRVITTAGGALFDAHEDSNYARKRRGN